MKVDHESTLVGFYGEAECGKDTIAAYLNKHHSFKRFQFAWPLKEAMKIIFGLTDVAVNTTAGKAEFNKFWGKTHREMLQQFGTETCRLNYDQEIWLKSMEQRLQRWVGERARAASVSDVRFKNEAKAIREWGGGLIKIIRPSDNLLSDSEKKHVSETELSGFSEGFWDWIIINDGTVEDLEKGVEKMLEATYTGHTSYGQQVYDFSMPVHLTRILACKGGGPSWVETQHGPPQAELRV